MFPRQPLKMLHMPGLLAQFPLPSQAGACLCGFERPWCTVFQDIIQDLMVFEKSEPKQAFGLSFKISQGTLSLGGLLVGRKKKDVVHRTQSSYGKGRGRIQKESAIVHVLRWTGILLSLGSLLFDGTQQQHCHCQHHLWESQLYLCQHSPSQ